MALKPKTKLTNTMNYEKLKTAFLQGGEKESSELLTDLLMMSVREAFW